MSQLMWIPVNSPKTIYSNNGMGDSQRGWQSSHKHVESAAAPTTSSWSVMANREETFPAKAAQLSRTCKSLSLVWRKMSHSSNDEAATVSSTLQLTDKGSAEQLPPFLTIWDDYRYLGRCTICWAGAWFTCARGWFPLPCMSSGALPVTH